MFKILIVEDDKDLNKTVCSFLNHSGYQAVGCLSAAEAYDALYETVFDCIISDIMMPGVDGFEFEVKGNAVHARFTVHSIYGDTEEETEVTI